MKKISELLSDLEKYENKGVFHFRDNDVLSLTCNIPIRKDYSGLYIFYSHDGELIYVGISGREDSDGNIIHRKDGLRGRFLTGKQFGDRRIKINCGRIKSSTGKLLLWFCRAFRLRKRMFSQY